jgi:hypothetical protein
MPSILVLPLELWDDDREAFKRAIDDFASGPEPAPAGTPVSPAVNSFLEANADALRAFHRHNWPKRGPGLLYLHWRLDEPPPAAPDLAWAERLDLTWVAGYPMVYAPAAAVPHMPTMVDLVKRYGSPTVPVLHCRSAHAEHPETKDQPYAIVLRSAEGAAYAAERALARAPEAPPVPAPLRLEPIPPEHEEDQTP